MLLTARYQVWRGLHLDRWPARLQVLVLVLAWQATLLVGCPT
jgi:hypothetical protein